MGSARSSQLAREKTVELERQLATAHRERELRRKQDLYEAQLVALKGQYESERDAILRDLDVEKKRLEDVAAQRLEIARLRRADNSSSNNDLGIQENGAKKARKGAVR